MIGDKIKSREPVTFAEALKYLEKKEDEKELEFEQRLAYDFVQKFSPLSLEKTEELLDELLDIEKVRKHQAVMLINNMPKNKEDIRLIFSKERTSLREETIQEILDIINNYRS